MNSVVGKGFLDASLTLSDIEEICANALAPLGVDGKRVLVLIPDHTRHAPIHLFFRVIYNLIGQRVKSLDFLIATGTHHPMPMEHIYKHVGITAQEHRDTYSKVTFFNHEHDNPNMLATIGTIPRKEMHTLTNGLFDEDIPVTVNKRLLEYDHLLIVSPVVPHEAVGFSGGNKYFFPGVGGVDIIQTFHWLAAIITNPVINGVKDTATRRVIDCGSAFLKVPCTCFAFTVDDQQRLTCLFVGEPKEAWSLAADYSAKLHIAYRSEPVKRILGIAPTIYDDIWVAGKVMYKHEPIIADGGEVIIYAPHIKEVSYTHGKKILKVGYHVPDYFIKQWDKFRAEPKLILAHSTNVKGNGTYENGVEQPRLKVTLATSIPEEICKRINLGYQDPRSINVEYWRTKQDDDLLVVENAGQVLYRLQDHSDLKTTSTNK